MPAAASSSAPVHTEVVHWLVSWAPRIPSSTRFSVMSARAPKPPGTSTISGCGTTVSGSSATSASWRLSVRYVPGARARNRTLAPGRRDSTS